MILRVNIKCPNTDKGDPRILMIVHIPLCKGDRMNGKCVFWRGGGIVFSNLIISE